MRRAPRSYCMPRLEEVYAACDFISKQMDSCDIHAIAKRLNIVLPRQLGNTQAEIDALPSWSEAQRG
jgi:hypothetical protein